MTDCYIYARVSTAQQGEIDRLGIPRQLDIAHRYARRSRLTVVRVFEDHASGSLRDRPALNEMLVALEQPDSPRVVLVAAADRLARKLVLSELVLERFRSMGVRLIACDSG